MQCIKGSIRVSRVWSNSNCALFPSTFLSWEREMAEEFEGRNHASQKSLNNLSSKFNGRTPSKCLITTELLKILLKLQSNDNTIWFLFFDWISTYPLSGQFEQDVLSGRQNNCERFNSSVPTKNWSFASNWRKYVNGCDTALFFSLWVSEWIHDRKRFCFELKRYSCRRNSPLGFRKSWCQASFFNPSLHAMSVGLSV